MIFLKAIYAKIFWKFDVPFDKFRPPFGSAAARLPSVRHWFLALSEAKSSPKESNKNMDILKLLSDQTKETE